MPNVLTYDLAYDAVDDVLVAGTLGRGAWTLPGASEVLPTTPEFFITDVTVAEGVGTAFFNVSLLTPAPDDIVLTLTTNDGTAVAVQDYITTVGQVTILRGTTTATGTLDVPILNDGAAELRETFTVSVQSVDSGSVGAVSNVGVGTITDNDAAVTVSIADTVLNESAGPRATTVTITRNTDSSVPLNITLVSSDTTEADIFGQATIPIGQTSVNVALDVIDDFLVDGDQSVTISAPVNSIPPSPSGSVLVTREPLTS